MVPLAECTKHQSMLLKDVSVRKWMFQNCSNGKYVHLFFCRNFFWQIRRIIGFEGAVKQVNRWEPVIKENRKVRLESFYLFSTALQTLSLYFLNTVPLFESRIHWWQTVPNEVSKNAYCMLLLAMAADWFKHLACGVKCAGLKMVTVFGPWTSLLFTILLSTLRSDLVILHTIYAT